MADGKVVIDTSLDTSGVDKGVNDLKKKLSDTGKSIDASAKQSNSLTKSLGGLNKGALVTAGAVAGVAVALKKTVDALNDCEEAYKVQYKAEVALQTAAKNNPYLNDESVYNLKNFASQMQKTSEVGDEASLQVMSQLAAMGRTEEQIIEIMSAAVDMAAVTGNSLGNVAIQLNKTYSGLAGELGEANSAVRELTQEQLKAGDAIKIIAAQYKGSAQAMADNTVQLSNAWGDFKQNIGKGWTKVTSPIRSFFTEVLSNINEAVSLTNDIDDAESKRKSGTDTAASTKILLDDATAKLNALKAEKETIEQSLASSRKSLEELQAEWDKTYGEYFGKYSDADLRVMAIPARPTADNMGTMDATPALALQRSEINAQLEESQERVNELTERYNELAEAEKKAADEANAQAEAEKKAQERRDKDAKAEEIIKANTQALAEQIEQMELRASVTGEDVAAGELYNAYLESYIELISKSNGLVTENNSVSKERLARLKDLAKAAKEEADAEERRVKAEELLKEAESLVNDSVAIEPIAAYQDRQAQLEEMRNAVMAAEIEDEEKKAAMLEQIDEESVKNRKRLYASMAEYINDYAQQSMEIVSNAASLALETSNNRLQAELDNLEIKYRQGELSEEEYQEKVAAAKKEGAKLQYKLEMAQWAMNLAMATSNTAVGVTQALASAAPPANIIMAALVGAAGAVQLASIMAAKPIPGYASGGFIGGLNGASLGADDTIATVRTGELVLNANQQRELWEQLNGERGINQGVNLTVHNSASNLVSTSAQMDSNQIELMIDARVNEGLRRGAYNSGLNAAQAGMTGKFYGV